MGENKFCVFCNKDVEIRKIITHGNYEEQILSCDHIGGRLRIPPGQEGTPYKKPYITILS